MTLTLIEREAEVISLDAYRSRRDNPRPFDFEAQMGGPDDAA